MSSRPASPTSRPRPSPRRGPAAPPLAAFLHGSAGPVAAAGRRPGCPQRGQLPSPAAGRIGRGRADAVAPALAAGWRQEGRDKNGVCLEMGPARPRRPSRRGGGKGRPAEDRPLDLGRLWAALHRPRQGLLQGRGARRRARGHRGHEAPLPGPGRRADRRARHHGRHRPQLPLDRPELPLSLRPRRQQGRGRHRRQEQHQDDRRPQGQDRGLPAGLALAAHAGRAPQGGRPRLQRRPEPEHDGRRCRCRLRRRPGRRRRDLGALAHPGQDGARQPPPDRQLEDARASSPTSP